MMKYLIAHMDDGELRLFVEMVKAGWEPDGEGGCMRLEDEARRRVYLYRPDGDAWGNALLAAGEMRDGHNQMLAGCIVHGDGLAAVREHMGWLDGHVEDKLAANDDVFETF